MLDLDATPLLGLYGVYIYVNFRKALTADMVIHGVCVCVCVCVCVYVCVCVRACTALARHLL